MKKSYSYFCFIFILSISGLSQEFAITTIEQTADNLIVHYDLLDTTKDRSYTVYLYLLTDSTIAPLKQVTGDVGLEVRPGANNKISWAAKNELGSNFKGGIQLEVRGKVYIPFIEFEGFPENQELKRGKSYEFAWTGKSSSNILEFKLYKENELKAVLPEVANTGDANIHLPGSMKPGKYRFYITDSRNKDQEVYSPVFVIKPTFPWPLKIVPLIAAGAAGYLLLTKESDDSFNVEAPPDVPGN
ncbi:MAG: hypothetical protein ABJG78_15095 [Cyclobacteriaceae bacterium]